MSQEPALLLSVKPTHVANMLAGTKTVELRRRRPQIVPGDLAIIYATHPVSAVVAAFTVERMVVAPPAELWESVKDLAAVDRQQYEAYFEGASTAVAIFLSDVRELHEPVHLSELKAQEPDFRPPQSFRYIRPSHWGRRISQAVAT